LKNPKPKQGVNVDSRKIREAVEYLKDELGNALIACDFFSAADGMPIDGYNSQPKASALFNQLTNAMIKTLQGAGFPNIDRYYLVDLEGDKMVAIVLLGDYRLGILMDTNKVQLGLLLSVVIPEIIKMMKD
jgi:hypothetical protein